MFPSQKNTNLKEAKARPFVFTSVGLNRITREVNGIIDHYSNPRIVKAVEQAVAAKAEYKIPAPRNGATSAAPSEELFVYSPAASLKVTAKVTSLKNVRTAGAAPLNPRPS